MGLLKTTKDGTLQATLGKKLYKSLKIQASSLKSEPYFLGTDFKEITFAIVPSAISLYIDGITEDHRLTLQGEASIEAQIPNAYIKVDASTIDTDMFEIWLWK